MRSNFPFHSVSRQSVPFLRGTIVLFPFLPYIFYTYTSINIHLSIGLPSIYLSINYLHFCLSHIYLLNIAKQHFKNLLQKFHCILLLNLVIQSTIDGHLISFQSLALTNNTAVNTHLHMSIYICASILVG